jgi:hypothetical protein
VPEIPAPVLSFRNKIINGNFDVWQRSEDITNGNNSWGIYSADRWWHNKKRSQKITDVVDGQTVNVLRISDEGQGYNGGRGLFQNIENYRYEKTVTLSAWIKASQASTINFGFVYDHTETERINDDFWIDVTTSWQKFTRTFKTTVPALGKSNQYIINDLTDGVTYEIAMIQLEEGEVATPFEHRPYGLELSLCQRYYWQLDSSNHPYPYLLMAKLSYYESLPFMFPVHMRVAPVVTTSEVLYAGFNSGTLNTATGFYIVTNKAGFDLRSTATSNHNWVMWRLALPVKADAEI